MRLASTTRLVCDLRERSRLLRPNNPRIDDWVSNYVDSRRLEGKPVTILTQWCLSKDIEAREALQGGRFVPTRGERDLFSKNIPGIARLFDREGIRFEWWITLNRSCLDSGRLNRAIEQEYFAMLSELAKPLLTRGDFLLVNWEDDIICRTVLPNQSVLENVESLINPVALAIEIERHGTWARNEAGIIQTEEELRRDVYYQIACEAEEGKLLADRESPLGECILIPLESPERYVFFNLISRDFSKRLVTVLAPYPWRLNSE